MQHCKSWPGLSYWLQGALCIASSGRVSKLSLS